MCSILKIKIGSVSEFSNISVINTLCISMYINFFIDVKKSNWSFYFTTSFLKYRFKRMCFGFC